MALAVLGMAVVGVCAGTGTLIVFRWISSPNGAVLPFPTNFLLVAVVLSVASSSVAIAFVALVLRHRDGVDEVFLVHESGLLLVHFSKTLKPEKDRDVVVAMLTAVQSFILEAFAKGSSRELRQMDFGERKILLRKGTHSYLAVVAQSRLRPGFTHRMRRALARVERVYGDVLVKWDGDVNSLSGADDLLLQELLGRGLRQTALGILDAFVRLGTWIVRAVRAPASIPARETARRSATDPRETAAALLRRSELESLRPGYRDLMSTALVQIEEGQFTLAGLTNLYLTMALQKSPRPSTAGWWDEVLRTVRHVLQTWPWDPSSQSWTLRARIGAGVAAAAAAPTDAPLSVPRPFPFRKPAVRHPILPRSRGAARKRKSNGSHKAARSSRRSFRT